MPTQASAERDDEILLNQCRSDDGLSDGELKVIARRCMRKVGGNSYMPGRNNDNTNNDKGAFDTRRQQKQGERHQQQQRGGLQNRNNNYNNDDEDAHDDYTDDNGNEYNGYMTSNNNNNNNNNNRNNQNYNSDRYPNFENNYISDAWGQRNRERIGSQQRLESSSGSSSSLNNARNARGRTIGDNTGDANNQTKYPRNNNLYNNNNNRNNNNNNDKSKINANNASIDSACIVHCFFDEMNMLNQDNYPDRHKVTYVLTKDLRNHELRSFYIETVEECFHYLASQRRLANRCQYSRNLINCMTEYARINCDDWDNRNLMFN